MIMNKGELQRELSELQQYRMSFLPTSLKGEFIINGLDIHRIFPMDLWSHVDDELKVTVLKIIENRIDFIINILKQQSCQ